MLRPTFSIIIPTFNRPKQVAACLQSLFQLNFIPEQFEIIVVNDGGNETEIADLFVADNTVTLLTQANTGPAAARNAGAAHARGDFLAFIDDDCQPDPDWLSELGAQLSLTPNCLLGGQTVSGLANIYALSSQLLVDYLYQSFNQELPVFFTSNNMIMAASLFHKLDGFDTTFSLAAGEDRDFCDKWRHAGYELVYVPTAVVNHYHHLTLRSFWQQHFNYGRGAYQYHQLRQLRQQRQQKPVKMEPFSFYKNLVLYPWRKGDGRKFKLSCLMFVTQLANALGFFYERWIGKKKTSQRLVSTDN